MVFNTRTENSKDHWETPQYFYDLLDKEFGFTLDAASSDSNHKCENYFTEKEDGLVQSWTYHNVFCNPPYDAIDKWIEKGFREGQKTLVVMLIPVRTDTQYWHKYIMKAKEVRLCKGRISFEINGKAQGSPNFASCVVIFNMVHKAKFTTMYHKPKDLINSKYKRLDTF